MEIRKPKKSDQENIEKGFNLVKELMQSHPEIESTLWFSVLLSCIVDGFINAESSYEFFCKEWEKAKVHYKSWFEEKY